MQYVQVPIGTLPVNLLMFPAVAGVAFVKVREFGLVGDFNYEGKNAVEAYFFPGSFVFSDDGLLAEGATDYFYGTIYQYKEIPLMLKWLQQQNLENPFFKE